MPGVLNTSVRILLRPAPTNKGRTTSYYVARRKGLNEMLGRRDVYCLPIGLDRVWNPPPTVVLKEKFIF
jgi:hypothetical protein